MAARPPLCNPSWMGAPGPPCTEVNSDTWVGRRGVRIDPLVAWPRAPLCRILHGWVLQSPLAPRLPGCCISMKSNNYSWAVLKLYEKHAIVDGACFNSRKSQYWSISDKNESTKRKRADPHKLEVKKTKTNPRSWEVTSYRKRTHVATGGLGGLVWAKLTPWKV